jgi:hypothetical protein
MTDALSETDTTHFEMYREQVVPLIPHKRDFHSLIDDDTPGIPCEEPTRKKPRIFEKSCLTHPSDGRKTAKKTVAFSEVIDEIYFNRIDSTRSLLNDGIDPDIEEYYPNMNLPGYSPNFTPLTPEQKTLKRTVSFFDLDHYWGDELDSELTKLDLGQVNS